MGYCKAVLIAAEMKKVRPDQLNKGLSDFLGECASLTCSVGGELVSRQAVAVAVATYEGFSSLTHDDH